MRPVAEMGVVDNRATEAARGGRADRWQVETVIARGYALATIFCGDLVPDHARDLEEGIPAFFRGPEEGRKPDDWRAISAWAWGLSRALDYCETDPDVDTTRAALSRRRFGETVKRINEPVGAVIGYHIRSGPHNITAYDWEQYLAFADRHL